MTTASIDPIAALWHGARAWFADMRARYGAPAQIATLARAACAALARELRALESLVLKLLLIEAARLHPSLERSKADTVDSTAREQAAAQAARRLRKLASMDHGLGAARQSGNGPDEACAQPETAPAAFPIRLPYDRPPHRTRMSRPRAAAQEPSPIDLVRRFAALAHVLADPASAITRLARKLRALGSRAHVIARRIAFHRPHAEPRDPTLFAHACVRCCDALEESG